MRTLLPAVAFVLAGCSMSSRMEPPPLSTISAKGAPERKCDRPATAVPREALYKLQTTPVRTTLRFEVLPAGKVGTVNVKESSGNRVLDDAAVRAITKLQCAPVDSEQPIWLETWYEFKVQ